MKLALLKGTAFKTIGVNGIVIKVEDSRIVDHSLRLNRYYVNPNSVLFGCVYLEEYLPLGFWDKLTKW